MILSHGLAPLEKRVELCYHVLAASFQSNGSGSIWGYGPFCESLKALGPLYRKIHINTHAQHVFIIFQKCSWNSWAHLKPNPEKGCLIKYRTPKYTELQINHKPVFIISMSQISPGIYLNTKIDRWFF